MEILYKLLQKKFVEINNIQMILFNNKYNNNIYKKYKKHKKYNN